MKNIRPVILEKYLDKGLFEPVSNEIYKDLSDGSYKITLSCELEEDEDSQYPLEDLLDRYSVNCTGYLQEEEQDGVTVLVVELEGSLSDDEKDLKNITGVSQIIGKRVYNKEQGGRISLVIE